MPEVIIVACAYGPKTALTKPLFFHVGVGRGQVSTYRAKNNKCRSFPPALPLHMCTRPWLTTGDVRYPPYAKQNLVPFATCCYTALRMLKTISLHFSRMKLNGCRFRGGPIVFQCLDATFVLAWARVKICNRSAPEESPPARGFSLEKKSHPGGVGRITYINLQSLVKPRRVRIPATHSFGGNR